MEDLKRGREKKRVEDLKRERGRFEEREREERGNNRFVKSRKEFK